MQQHLRAATGMLLTSGRHRTSQDSSTTSQERKTTPSIPRAFTGTTNCTIANPHRHLRGNKNSAGTPFVHQNPRRHAVITVPQCRKNATVNRCTAQIFQYMSHHTGATKQKALAQHSLVKSASQQASRRALVQQGRAYQGATVQCKVAWSLQSCAMSFGSICVQQSNKIITTTSSVSNRQAADIRTSQDVPGQFHDVPGT